MQIFDILVVGGGTAGMTCALVASQNGAKVLVVEKTAQIGGTLHITAGHLSAGGTQRQKSWGIEDSPELHFQDIRRINQDSGDMDLIRLACEEAPKTIDWLDRLGFEFADDSPKILYGHVPYQIPRTHFGKNLGKSILKVILPLFEKQVADGAITLALNQTFLDLILDNNQGQGIITKNTQSIENQLVTNKYYARKIVLASGGYAGNHSFFAQKHPDLSRLITTASPHSLGEGIQVTEKYGAIFHKAENHISTMGGIELNPQSGVSDFWANWAKMSNSVDRKAYEIYVNEEGKRFLDENEANPDIRERALAHQPNRRCWVILDEEILQTAGSIVYQWNIEQFKTEAQKGRAVWQAESLAELATKIGVLPNNLLTTIENYNQAVDNQLDIEFKRVFLPAKIQKPPFYAVLTYAFSLISFGGLKVNSELKVVRQNGQTFENLYAIGEILGAGATSGNAFCGGMLLTPALSLGRYLGKKLADEVL
ncbi:MAG: FAD-dependent oxidoreductase [Microscillaceae bacterium]|jgi:fumarate reductase flavoprotein subunit|nr:FAD-dependent oxidoreductase [Microscillaceae bacterium]